SYPAAARRCAAILRTVAVSSATRIFFRCSVFSKESELDEDLTSSCTRSIRTISWQVLQRYLTTRDCPSTSRRRITVLQCGQRTTTAASLQPRGGPPPRPATGPAINKLSPGRSDCTPADGIVSPRSLC